jgi:protein-disulfide isomerase
MSAPVSMRPWLLGGLLLVAATLGAGLALVAQSAIPIERERTGQLVRAYLLDHPELLRETADRLHLKESGKLIADNRAAILDPYAGAQAGNPRGDVTLVEYLDYACGYCRASLPEIATLLAKDHNVRIVYREYPVLSAESRVAAGWALAAAEQGKYRAFHDALYGLDGPTDANIQAAARTAGLDLAKAATAANSQRIAAEIDKNLAVGGKLGVNGTPGWVIGDRIVVGAIPYEQLADTVAEARKSRG